MARAHVVKVESNVKCGVVAQPGPLTLIVGPNGAGKSAIVNAIELAGSGRASDVAGRVTLAKDADLAMLLAADKGFAAVRLSDGSPAQWSLEKGHRAARSGAEIAFPLRDVRDALLGAAETARKWLLAVAGTFAWDRVVDLVPKSLHTRLASVAPAAAVADAPSTLVSALETARKRTREANATAKAQRAIKAPALPPPSAEAIAELERMAEAWRVIETSRGAAESLEGVRAEYEKTKVAVTALQGKIADAQRAIAALPAPSISPLLPQATAVAEALAAAKVTTCPLCSNKADPAAFAQRAAIGQKKIAEVANVERQRTTLTTALAGLVADRNAAERLCAQLAVEVQRWEALAGSIPAAPAISRDEVAAQLAAARDARAGWDAARRSEEAALEAEREADEWGRLSDALAKALGQLVEAARLAFEKRVSLFLPGSDVFGVDLLDNEREILRVGLRRNGALHAALSGAEWARVTAALALATAPATGPCVICPEERAFDPATLASVLEAFGEGVKPLGDDAPQVIVASPVAPAKVPPGWTVIEVGGGAKAPEPEAPAPAADEEAAIRAFLVANPKAKPSDVIREFKGRFNVSLNRAKAAIADAKKAAAEPPAPTPEAAASHRAEEPPPFIPPPEVAPSEAVSSLFDDV